MLVTLQKKESELLRGMLYSKHIHLNEILEFWKLLKWARSVIILFFFLGGGWGDGIFFKT